MKRPHQDMSYTRDDFEHSPFIVFYEITRACDLACKHCRACAIPYANPKELKHEQSKLLIDQLASFPKKPILVFSGGDPMKRDDLEDLVKYAKSKKLRPALTPSATPLTTRERLLSLKKAGISAVAVSLDASSPEAHDQTRGVQGSFEQTLEMMRWIKDMGIRLQVNTVLSPGNLDQVDQLAHLLDDYGIALWSVFFLVPVGRGRREERITPQQYEAVFEKLWDHAKSRSYAIKTTEAHHYRRFVLQHQGNPIAEEPCKKQHRSRMSMMSHRKGTHPSGNRAPLGVNDGRGIMFISHTGKVYPAGFLPLKCGQFPEDHLVDVYQNNPVFKALRDPDQFKGKCSVCEFRQVCGGSRARAYAVTGDFLAAEPDCIYQPKNWVEQEEEDYLNVEYQ